MIKKILCFIWGHKTVLKAYTGESKNIIGMCGNEYTTLYYKYEKMPYCIRCGKNMEG